MGKGIFRVNSFHPLEQDRKSKVFHRYVRIFSICCSSVYYWRHYIIVVVVQVLDFKLALIAESASCYFVDKMNSASDLPSSADNKMPVKNRVAKSGKQ